MKFYAEMALYTLQIASAFILAGPKLVQAERQRTLSRNPGWVRSHPEFLSAKRKASLTPLFIGGTLIVLSLAFAWGNASPAALFAVHGPIFSFILLALLGYYGFVETRLRKGIPKEAVQRAPLTPRTTFRFLSPWSVAPLGFLLTATLATNAIGFFTGSIAPARVLGNLALLGILSGGMLFGFFKTIRRRPYRMSMETDALARRFELKMVLTAGYFLAAATLCHAVGSLGPDPVFSDPPTYLHALIEGKRFSWQVFFTNPAFRVIDYSATAFLILFGIGIANSGFYKKVLALDFGREENALKV